ncbi:MAG: SDR family NAD(P)-dependent oxidoreductase, partial [Marinobacter sp.]
MSNVCVVMGVGPGNGEAFVRRFSDEGYQVAMLARSKDYLLQLEQSISNTYAFPCDLMESEQIGTVLAAIRDKLGPAAVLLYNAG